MSDYIPPLKDMQFVLHELAGFDTLAALPGHEEIDADLAHSVLEEAGKFATGVLSPLNLVGDRQGCRWKDGEVTTAPGWLAAYRQFAGDGWNALSCPPAHGGQGLPRLVSALVEEMWNGANVAFALCGILTRGAIEALETAGSPELQATYLPKMVSGEWTGTMNLTEPQAGSDLAAVRTRAVPRDDGTYAISGQKIFITYGEHDLAENIVHLVLARTPGAPEGVKGISLFVVPKFLVNTDGSLGARNDVRCVSIEHKLGIHGSPTAVLQFGDAGGATGWLVGQENRGLEYMFIMMNAARFSVGLEGVGLCERAYQRALAYARMRTQGSEVGSASRDKVAILRHPDVRRMLLQMKSRTEALRAVACVVAAAMDSAAAHPDKEERARQQGFVDLMIPIVKGWSTESAVLVASMGVQIHGGMGFIEETGAAQHLRDARILPIYEGTTGIQAADLVGRKIARDGGRAVTAVMVQMRQVQEQLRHHASPRLQSIGDALAQGVDALSQGVDFVLETFATDARKPLTGSVPLLELLGIVAGGWQLGRAALAADARLQQGGDDAGFLQAKLDTAAFYAEHVMSAAAGLAHAATRGADTVLGFDDAFF